MTTPNGPSRRDVLRLLAIGVSLQAVAANTVRAAEAPLLSEGDPKAKELNYVGDAHRAPTAKAGDTCANCSLYSGATGTTQGGCSLFPDKQVKAAGWCTAWTDS
jgi:hypothetical protein